MQLPRSRLAALVLESRPMMPRELEQALMKSFSKKKAKLHGKSKKSMVFATMTNMQKKGEIEPWRKLK